MMTSVTYPSGRVVEFTPTTPNRVSAVKRSGTENYLSGAQYSASGALQSARGQ
jgi:hypothetical protein